jgi:hypothetical protein
MKVRCKLCEFENGGFCSKKTKANHPIKIKVNKARTCDLYSEDGLRVLGDFRKREAHRAILKQQELQRAKFEQLRKTLEETKDKLPIVTEGD